MKHFGRPRARPGRKDRIETDKRKKNQMERCEMDPTCSETCEYGP